ncbi:sensor histidine kinase [Variovorax boronicumulans]|uniref:sensor histidine kinase n=1 Tax=Variovorax boronicumulans TaxID=436515 RepID=UPI0033993F64
MPIDAYDAILRMWSDERFWLSFVAWALLMLNWRLGGLRGGSLTRWMLLAVVIQAAPTVGALLLRFFTDHAPAEELPLALIALQSINVVTLIALMAAARTPARPAAAQPDNAQAPAPDALSAALAERQRISRDLHDGVASRLVMLLASIPVRNHTNTEIARGLQDCLLELQMTVDGLSGERMSLGEMLGNLRYRFEPAFRRSGIELQWDVTELPEADDPDGGTPDDGPMHRELCKIVQEALANALRHSGARRVQLRLAPGRGNARMVLEVSDDGWGLPESVGSEAPRTWGRGLRNMQARAEAIGAGIRIANLSTGGLRVGLTLPQTDRAVELPHPASLSNPLHKGWST